MRVIDEILGRNEFIENPPVLLDIGASGQLHEKWKDIAKHSICIAFDADKREMSFVEKETDNYKKLYVYNCVVSDKSSDESDFYLTRSPFCSSMLYPATKKLEDWEFADIFEVKKQIKIKTVDLPTVISELNIQKIDWFKTDSQGIDLRLFKSLGEEIINKILVAEFEPGIIDAYEGEDKFVDLMLYMDTNNFWMSDINILGSKRLSKYTLEKLSEKISKNILSTLKISPGWVEVLYFNDFKQIDLLDKRDFLLGWIFSIIEGQYGFALEIALKGFEKYDDEIFKKLEDHTLKELELNYQVELKKYRSLSHIIKKISEKIIKSRK
ncbi:MAG: hypothetical protein A2287_06145 [Candidatus Melainabacteria bacterium RIFOXYA12_FULL_32_12]|nr:MAG: hypothetical protein A2255_00745 [Candidatus Melainabacteria bacterium RIFOXYA2_FULL_32_9]OGI27560.1 MAG: hypothetical protein A2287_06145 [Candidatus Melainabacteria bacterium RIFOXYA12_FULL_32_12]